VPIAVIGFDFDPLLQLVGDLVVRWQTIALAATIAAVLLVTGAVARRSRLRPDDLLYIVVGVVPGAVIGGRLGYALVHADLFGSDPTALFDPAHGGLDLAAGVLGGLLTGTYVASLLGAPVGRWAHLLALPVLILLGAGKLTMVLGGSGQGLPFDGTWATAYLGAGPWGSLAPALPSHPSQAYEGFATLLVATLLMVILAAGGFRRRDGRALLIAIAGWALVRTVVSTTWRDPVTVGPLGAAGWFSLALAVGCLVATAVITVRSARDAANTSGAAAKADPAWPDAETRPRF
jgi:prolipoprotein diacylglyceryltransferase